MQVGVCLPHYGKTMEPAGMRQFAEAAESLGFGSLFVTDHVIMPKGSTTPYLNAMLDPLATLNYLAGVTSRIRIGTSVIILPYRHPVLVAKEVATADALSGGRVIFGAAVGWAEEEFRALNANFEERGDVADEYLRAIRGLWADPDADFKGRYVTIQGVHFSPSPAQTPHPPVWIGGSSKRAGRRAVELGDAWHATNVTVPQLREVATHMRHLSMMRGRAKPPALTMRMPVYLDSQPPQGRVGASGDERSIIEQTRAYAEAGVEHVVFAVPEVEFSVAMRQLERLGRGVLPALR
ncbi:MAG: LLM class F420-dependent oxidoreductase [SAR202 cluster bacterium]|nr:LLM class F420-dependent oxidoreductase [SAR202 cluster bacterium]